jgi:hypothetical protein
MELENCYAVKSAPSTRDLLMTPIAVSGVEMMPDWQATTVFAPSTGGF